MDSLSGNMPTFAEEIEHETVRADIFINGHGRPGSLSDRGFRRGGAH